MSQNWEYLGPFPGFDKDDAIAVAGNENALFVSGVHGNGANYSNDCYLFNYQNQNWTISAEFPGSLRQYAGGQGYENEAYIFAGVDPNGEGLNDFWRFSFESNLWTSLPDCPFSGRWSLGTFLLENSIYVVGGETELGPSAEVWRYDLNTQKWNQLPDFPGGARKELVAGHLWSFGYVGLGANENTYYADWWRFNPIDESWERLSDFPGGALTYTQIISDGQNLICGSGFNGNEEFNNQFFKFDGFRLKWVPVSSLGNKGIRGCSSFAHAGQFYLLTGLNEEFERETDLWSIRLEVSDEVLVYPNPSSDCIYFVAPNSTLWNLYNAHGQKVRSGSVDQGTSSICDLSPGIYYLRKTDLEQSTSEKVVIR